MDRRIDIRIRNSEAADVIEISGWVAANESGVLLRNLEEHLADGVRRAIVLDFSEADYISSTGLGAVLWLGKRMREARLGFALSGLRGRVAQAFKLSGLDRIMDIYPEPADAEAAFERGEAGAGT